MSGEILFLAHRVPYPPDRGDKIRSHHLLRALAELAPVHVGCFGETDADMAAGDALAQIAASHRLVRRSKPLPQAGLEALASGQPVSLTAFDSPALRAWVAETLAQRPIDTVFVFSGQMGQYVPADFAGRVVIDLCDVDSAKFADYARDHSWPRAVLDRREAKLLAREEQLLVRRADATLLVSEAEADLLRGRLAPAEAAKVRALGNGIDTALFDPLAVEPHAELAAVPGPHFVFTGQMDYPPNIEAALRAIDRLMPGILARHPDARFHVVGRAPVAELVAREGRNGARIWGEVADVRPFLAGADLVLAPLTIARGVQNKVLEAMAMARPVVLTSGAATGIDARDGQHFVVADDDAELVASALALLGNGDRARQMGAAARRFVIERLSWPAALANLPAMVGRAAAKKPSRYAA
jgi:sugar transferase (PEP-CTERM/EpsH1 system associated)